MKKIVLILSLVAVASVGFMTLSSAVAQDRSGFGGGRFPRMSPEEMAQRAKQFRQRMLEHQRQELGFSEEEWAAVEPLYSKVSDLNRQLSVAMRRFSRMGRPGGRDRGGRPDANQSSENRSQRRANPLAENDDPAFTKAIEALESVLEDENAQSEQIVKALAAYRLAREDLEKQLEAARTQLKSVLTQRQEAQLVLSGLLR